MSPVRVAAVPGVLLLLALFLGTGSVAVHSAEAAATPATSTAPVGGLDGVLRLVEQYPIVALGERHSIAEEHDFFAAIVRDRRFAGRIQDFIVEFGNARFQSIMDRYIAGEHVPYEQLRQCWRDTTQAATQAWESPVYEQFFATVREVNQNLPPAQRYRVLLGDPAIDWNTVRTPEALLPFLEQRDAHFADVVLREVLGKNRRGVLIAGAIHVFKEPRPSPAPNVVNRILAQHPNSVAVVLPHTGGIDEEEVDDRLREWPVPSLALLEASWLGDRVFLDLDTPSGPVFIRWREAADALLWLGPPRFHAEAVRNPLAYVGERQYLTELSRRYELSFGLPFNPNAVVYYLAGHPPREH